MSNPSPFYRGVPGRTDRDSDDDMAAFDTYLADDVPGGGSSSPPATTTVPAAATAEDTRAQAQDPPPSEPAATANRRINFSPSTQTIGGGGGGGNNVDKSPGDDTSPPAPLPAGAAAAWIAGGTGTDATGGGGVAAAAAPSTGSRGAGTGAAAAAKSAAGQGPPFTKAAAAAAATSARATTEHHQHQHHHHGSEGGGTHHHHHHSERRSSAGQRGGLFGGGGDNSSNTNWSLMKRLRSMGSASEEGGGGGDAAERTSRSNSSSVNVSLTRTRLFADKLYSRRTSQLKKSRMVPHFGSGGGGGSGGEESSQELDAAEPRVIRRYKVGDSVLVSNLQSRWVNLVNRHGYPPGGGELPEERRGPYRYTLATVKQVHFEEIQAYYTVTRRDTAADQRADADYMEPLRTGRGEVAAAKAATEPKPAQTGETDPSRSSDSQRQLSQNKCLACLELACLTAAMPFLWLFECCGFVGGNYIAPVWAALSRFVKRNARLLLNGLQPYRCRIRLTCVNFVVVCCTWYMFIDQLRLAFFPSSADDALAAINFAVWIVLVLELLFESFIRPDGYYLLIQSDKAFAPTTVRYISSIHLVVEALALLIFIPEWLCIFGREIECDDRLPFSFYNAVLMTVVGPTKLDVFYGHAFLALTRLRAVGLLRHWRNMWISNTFINMTWRGKNGMLSSFLPFFNSAPSHERKTSSANKKPPDPETVEKKKREAELTNASTIGTALMVTNSYRAMALLLIIIGLFPIIIGLQSNFYNPVAYTMTRQMQGTNLVADDTSNETCDYLRDSTWAWIASVSPQYYPVSNEPFLLTLQLRPVRCEFQQQLGSMSYLCLQSQATIGDSQGQQYHQKRADALDEVCDYWDSLRGSSTSQIARSGGLRAGSVLNYQNIRTAMLTNVSTGITNPESFSVQTLYDASNTVSIASKGSFLLQLCLLIGILGGLSVLRRDAEVLVLGPLRRMLRRMAQYARNPLMPPKINRHSSRRQKLSGQPASSIDDEDDLYSISSYDDEDHEPHADDLGSYETEQLNTAVNKITDLLRKCWGVAGADIISTNLDTREGALTEVFNPTVAGKSVYALFAFASINDFGHALRELQDDVMVLINDVAAVLHGEVFRWGFGDSGQCNKNLGSAFLMVFRIGLVKEVLEKLEEATDVVFSTGTAKSSHASGGPKRRNRSVSTSRQSTKSSMSSYGSSSHHSNSRTASHRKTASMGRRKVERSSTVKAMSLSLQSLPGISTFTDRAVIGMLKSFAGIYRDNNIRKWNNDFRLGQGVGIFTVSIIFGMDAGWAVEGAVGSEYKIDATYLSPHVNMASRMMSACKLYNVNIMLSQAVQELMSETGRSKMRHLDTVTVKGSSVKQKIFTYDARPKGVDFFLYSRSDDQADMDAERYSPQTWNNDQDLKAMRQHVSDEFLDEFNSGRKAYLAGDWPKAIPKLERANEIMVETALEQGYLEDEFEALQAQMGHDARGAEEELKRENGDGPSLFLVGFMKNQGGIAPKGWDGWHPLTRK